MPRWWARCSGPARLPRSAGADPDAVAARLHRLVANEVIRRRRRSAVAGQDEYEFLHVLVRDVAYGQIPRRDRIGKHRAAAAWIERLAEDRPTAHAELARAPLRRGTGARATAR